MRALLPGVEAFDAHSAAVHEPSWWSYMDAYTALRVQGVKVRPRREQRNLLQRPLCGVCG